MTTEAPILFLLPGSIGYGLREGVFANAIRPVAKVVSIKYPDLKGMLAGNNTVTSIADIAVEQIQRNQPVGDIRLLGHSFGGSVGFEVAARLLKAGRTVSFLGILDTVIVEEPRDYQKTLSRIVRRVRTNRINVKQVACRTLAKVTCKLGYEAQLFRLIERYSQKKFNTTCFRIKFELQEILRTKACYQWIDGPKTALPLHGTLFRCDCKGVPPSLGWDCWFASLDVIPVVGDHADLILEPHLSNNLPLIAKALSQTYELETHDERVSA